MEELLPLTDHPEVAVVENGELHLDPLLHHRGHLGHVHLESAIAGDRPYRLIGTREADAHGGGDREAHRAQTTRGDVRVGTLEGVTLRHPHLMLPHVGHDRAAPAGDIGQRGQNHLGRQATGEQLLPIVP